MFDAFYWKVQQDCRLFVDVLNLFLGDAADKVGTLSQKFSGREVASHFPYLQPQYLCVKMHNIPPQTLHHVCAYESSMDLL